MSYLIYFVRCLSCLIVLFVGGGMVLGGFIDRGLVLAIGGLIVIAGGLLSFPRAANAWRRDPPTNRQIAYAQTLGIEVPHGISKGELSDLITAVTGK